MADPHARGAPIAPAAADDALPPSRVVRWLLLAGVILLGVSLYFRWGLDVPPVGSAPAPAAETAPTPTR